ncbi:MAG: tRNA nucleotidyltransferase [Clostridia bacterium]|nr:tRNA nucleotidyltransferase [Clostridia bacterium]
MAHKIAEAVSEKSGEAYFVGGYVRDLLRGEQNKDIDIEIHGVTPKELESILDSLGQRINIGESFGIYALKGYSIDIAMPRQEKLIGKGHRDFDICADPFIGAKKAAMRRDFTVNAMMQNILTGEVLDFFDGGDDLKNKVIRHVNNEAFCEDSLRVLRAAQFAARFEFEIADETVELCKTIDLSALSKERVAEELYKALLKAEKPSLFFTSLQKMNALSPWFDEVFALIGVEQNKRYHAEGDVWNHTMMTLDAAASLRSNVKNPRGFMLSALTHDFGKALCTEVVNGQIKSHGHEIIGLPLVDKFLHRITNERALIQYVMNMTELHMEPNKLVADNSSVKATNRLFDKSREPLDLIYLATADSMGQITEVKSPSRLDSLLDRLQIFEQTMQLPYVTGKDLIDAGLAPDKDFSEILGYAHKLRLAGVEKESALKQTLAYASKQGGDKK